MYRSLGLVFLSSAVFAAPAPNPVTFSKDVAPILQGNCETCHRPGEAAPMSLRTYQESRPWAAAISEAVTLKKMPPWFADPKYGHFANDRSLKQKDIDTLVAWAQTGAKEGNPKDLPKPAAFITGWNIGQPDLQIEMPAAFKIPATGTLDYQYILVPGDFKKDTWVEQAEVRPGNRALIHHVIAFIRTPGSKWMKDLEPGVPLVPKKEQGEGMGEFLVGYAPGVIAIRMEPGRAMLIKAGSDIVLQLHYTANGKEGEDRTKVGFVFAKGPVKERVMTLAATDNKFAIPAGDSNYRVDSSFEFGDDAKIISYGPHMHLRGKDFEFRAVYPTGETETLLKVPNYSFSWQLTYFPVKDLVVPKGSKIECIAHYDNSANNPNNPDPTKVVKYGDQSWEEMMFGFFSVAFDADKDPKSLFPQRKKPAPAAALE
ncbi:MAG: thiol-disulfide isomerase [Acidobacteriota bacterium]|nr:thiol-disulfide isomerase [Acidobacteriota bacterium]